MRPSTSTLGERSPRPLVLSTTVAILGAGVLAVLTAPLARLLAGGAGVAPAALHATVAFLYLFVGTIGLHLGWRLVRGDASALPELQSLATVAAVLSFLAIAFGHWLALTHQLPVTTGSGAALRFKQAVGVLTLPVTVAAAFLLRWHGVRIAAQPRLRGVIAALLALSFVLVVAAFVLGTAFVSSAGA